MKINLRLSKQNRWFVDRILLCVLVAWAIISATCHVEKANNENVSPANEKNIEQKINKIYQWCEESLAPAEK